MKTLNEFLSRAALAFDSTQFNQYCPIERGIIFLNVFRPVLLSKFLDRGSDSFGASYRSKICGPAASEEMSMLSAFVWSWEPNS